ncbi:hypothetical protein FGO68_gene10819 [Halteria grandinella]|uniref:Uncharacterized protein n=1 Tax=Halteria grandinella TaxID=5974 RepID=A0A8J8T9S7_HALGN|nr:hypothetical protein FGO68_gene10819 [Halteria grandinella]
MPNIWSLLTIVTFILTILAHSSLQACVTVQAPFPKIIGGIQGATQFYQIDYNPVSGHLIGGGFSQDQGVRGDSLGTTGYPIVAAYKGAEFQYQWGKAFSNLQSYDYFTGQRSIELALGQSCPHSLLLFMQSCWIQIMGMSFLLPE